MRTLCKDIAGQIGKQIEMMGWIHRIRELGGVSFVVLRDRSGQAQLVYQGKLDFTLETVVKVSGTVAANDKAPGGAELQVAETIVLGAADGDLPFPVNQDPDKTSLEVILDNRQLSLRNPKLRGIFTIQSAICKYFAEYLRGQDFTEVKTTKLTSTGAEGGTGLFEVDYFEHKLYLAQSPQLYKQTMVASGLERVFEIADAYRAEKHDTPRHLNEYVSMDVEMAFIESEAELMELERGILKHVFTNIQKEHADILALWGATVPTAAQVDAFPVVPHEEAKAIVSERLGHRIFEINPEAERVICEWAMEKHGCDGVFINDFPRKKRPFYAYPKGLKTMSFDLVFRGLEITTGGRRINEYAMMQDALPKFGLTEEGVGQWYIDNFKYGCPPHGGFAIGLERLTQKILGLYSVKEASLFPRDRKRIHP
jgi:nondiscriminating aspartyl-tRNA synthetase